MKYKKITEKNFESFTKKYVQTKGCDDFFIGLDMPKNLEEFREFTKNIYGIELSVDCLAYPKGSFSGNDYSCKYQITGMYEHEYSQTPIMMLWDKKYGQYDGLKVLLNTCFGTLSCGGVASYHYGQTRCGKETWKRIANWDGRNTEKCINSYIEQQKSLAGILY